MNLVRVLYYLRNNRELLLALAIKHPKWFSDKLFLKTMFRHFMGTELNLNNPKTFSEKLQWLKLYDRKPEYTRMVDKYEAKKYVAGIIGEEYIIPTLAVYNSTSEIDLEALPDKFVLKCTHDSGSVAICKDKKTFQKREAFAILEKGLSKNYFWQNREWPYKNVKPRIIAETYMEDIETQELRDYKFFCFDGKVKALFIAEDRQGDEETKFDFFDADFFAFTASERALRTSEERSGSAWAKASACAMTSSAESGSSGVSTIDPGALNALPASCVSGIVNGNDPLGTA